LAGISDKTKFAKLSLLKLSVERRRRGEIFT
jgi:hypothetical protein